MGILRRPNEDRPPKSRRRLPARGDLFSHRALRIEPLEDRRVLSVTVNPISGPDPGSVYNVPSGKNLYVPLTGADPGQTITYSATSSYTGVTATVLSNDPTLVLNVSGTSAQGPFTGTLTFQLFAELAPQTVQAIINNVKAGDYTNSSFYRMETSPSFQLIQGGTEEDVSPPSIPTVPNEYNTAIAYNTPGLLAMAATSAHVASSEFFVTGPAQPLANEPQALNFGYTIFGQLLTGQNIYNEILNVPTSNQEGVNIANTPVTITSASILATNTQNAVLQISEPAGFTGSTNITVTGTGTDNTSAQRTFGVSVVTPTSPAAEVSVILAPVSNQTTAPGQPVTFQISANDTTGGTPTFSIGDHNPFDAPPYPLPANVTATVTPGAGNTATVTLIPHAGFTGTLNLVAHADDSTNGLHDAQAFTLTVGGPLSIATPGVTQHVNAAGFLGVTGVSITDPSLPTTGLVTTTFSAMHGVITLSTAVTNGLTASQITGNGTSNVTVTAPLAATNATLAAINGLVYVPSAGFSGSDTLTIAGGDTLGNSATGSVAISVVSVFSINAPSTTLATLRNGSLPITGLSLTDTGLPSADNVTMTFSAANGFTNLATNVVGGITNAQLIGNRTDRVTVTAPLAAINATLAAASGVTYTPGFDYTGPDTLAIAAVDALDNSTTASLSISVGLSLVTPDAIEVPSGTNFGISGISISDAALPTSDTISLQIVANHGNLRVATNIVGGVTSVVNNNASLVMITGTVAQINTTLAAVGGLKYRSALDYVGPDTLSLSAVDPLQSSSFVSIPLTIVGPLSINSPSGGLVQADLPFTIAGVSIDDPGLPATDQVTVALTAANGTLSLSSIVSGGITAAQMTGNGTKSVTVTATLAEINATLADANGLTYTSFQGFAGPETVTFSAHDTAGNSDSEQVLLAVIGPLTLSLPSPQHVNAQGSPTVVTGISVSDPGMSGSSNVTMTLQAAHGVLDLATTAIAGLNASQIIGNGTASVTITAPYYVIDNTLADANGLTYTPNPGYIGPDTIAATASDIAGNSAAGSISLGQPFLINAPVSLQGLLNQPTAITGIALQDPDLPTDDNVTAEVYVQNGTLTFSTTVAGGLTNNQISGNGLSFVIVTGTLAQINATLSDANGLIYEPINGFVGSDNLGITAFDPLLNTTSANISLAVNPPLTIVVPGEAQIVGVDRDLSINGISLNDPLTPLSNIVTTFAVEHGSLLFSTSVAAGLTSAQILGNGTNLVTILAPVAAINATLSDGNGLLYTPNSGYTGADNLSITSEDTLEDTANANVALAVAGPLSITGPTGTQFVQANATTGFVVSVSDPGLPTSQLVTMTFSATSGTIFIPTFDFGGRLTAEEVTGNGTSNVVVTAPVRQLNSTLQSYGLSYSPTFGYTGPDSVAIVASDQVDNVATASVAILVAGPITIAVPPSSPPLRVSGSLVISGVSVTDPGLPSTDKVNLVISASWGRINLATNVPGGVTSDEVDVEAGVVFILATLSQINTTLAAPNSLSYVPNQGYDGYDVVTFVAEDLVSDIDDNNIGVNTIGVRGIPPAEVLGISVDSTNWAQPFFEQLPGFVQGASAGYNIPAGVGQSLDLPWSNLNQVRIQFNENVNVQLGSLSVTGQAVSKYAIAGFSYDPTTFTAVWTLTQPIGADHVQVHLSSTGPTAVTDQAGHPLDGEWTNGASAWPSGDGTAGGDFHFSFNVLPGDVNQDGIVNAQDLALLSSGWMKSGMTGDINGDGIVNGQDLAVLSANWHATLPPVSGGASQPALSSATSSPLAAVADDSASSGASETTSDSGAATVSVALTTPASQPSGAIPAFTLLANAVPASAVVPVGSATSGIVSAATVTVKIGETTSSVAAALGVIDVVAPAVLSSPPAARQAVDRLATYLGNSLATIDAPAVDHIFGQQAADRDLVRSLLSAAAQPRSILADIRLHDSSALETAWHIESAAGAALDDELAVLLARKNGG